MNLVAFVTFLVFSGVANAQYNSCQTPNSSNGLCKPIRSCSSVIQLLQQQMTPQTRDFLQKSQCKIDREPWVCCPDGVASSVQNTPNVSNLRDKLPRAPECGIDSPNRIFGGEPTAVDEYPWLAQIQYKKPGNRKGFHCGGSLIHKRYVLTAAHCVNKVPADWQLVSVRLGEWDTKTDRDCDDSYNGELICSDPHVDVPVEKKIVHENYQPSSKHQHHDIALLRLTRNVPYTEFIKPICLPVDSQIRRNDLSGNSLTVAGWGKTEVSPTSTKKLKVSIDVYANQKCQQVYAQSQVTILDEQLCAGGDPGRDSCNGDSGGPLMKYYEQGSNPHYYLAGVVSYGPKNCGTPGIPGVYTRVSKYIEWIEKNISE